MGGITKLQPDLQGGQLRGGRNEASEERRSRGWAADGAPWAAGCKISAQEGIEKSRSYRNQDDSRNEKGPKLNLAPTYFKP